ncbi:STAS domain-containing protein [Georgenia soli]|uniref:STAS domain-containing protein n=1 Tax=Georgenia soli TaxID=638953 RepID=A0A2A9ESR3_9MICO|nr:STAS domain-containing protein [Georgenia soli]PFG41310.1 STAS domain-containing protein [Georgenia soli]
MSDAAAASTGPRADEQGLVSVLTSPARVRIVLAGPVDASLSDELATAAREAADAGVPVDVDTRTVTFMDSTVIAAIAHLAHRISHRVRFIEPPDLVRFLLEVTHIGEVVDVVDHDPGFPGALSPTSAR